MFEAELSLLGPKSVEYSAVLSCFLSSTKISDVRYFILFNRQNCKIEDKNPTEHLLFVIFANIVVRITNLLEICMFWI